MIPRWSTRKVTRKRSCVPHRSILYVGKVRVLYRVRYTMPFSMMIQELGKPKRRDNVNDATCNKTKSGKPRKDSMNATVVKCKDARKQGKVEWNARTARGTLCQCLYGYLTLPYMYCWAHGLGGCHVAYTHTDTDPAKLAVCRSLLIAVCSTGVIEGRRGRRGCGMSPEKARHAI